MMILLFFLLSIVIAGVVATVKSRQAAHWTAACYYGVQILFAAFVVGNWPDRIAVFYLRSVGNDIFRADVGNLGGRLCAK